MIKLMLTCFEYGRCFYEKDNKYYFFNLSDVNPEEIGMIPVSILLDCYDGSDIELTDEEELKKYMKDNFPVVELRNIKPDEVLAALEYADVDIINEYMERIEKAIISNDICELSLARHLILGLKEYNYLCHPNTERGKQLTEFEKKIN
jgi:hypothetical protein